MSIIDSADLDALHERIATLTEDNQCIPLLQAETERLRVESGENSEFAAYWRRLAQEARDALKPFAELAGKLDGAPNLVGLLTEADFKRAADVFAHEQDQKP